MKRLGQILAVLTAFMTLSATQAFAGAATLYLVQNGSEFNVADAIGRWNYEGGLVKKNVGGTLTTIGYYSIQRRVVNAGSTTTAITTVNMNFTSYAYNITLQGSHSFATNNFYGSVSATSNRYAFLKGAEATYVPSGGTMSVLSLSWTGSSQLTLP